MLSRVRGRQKDGMLSKVDLSFSGDNKKCIEMQLMIIIIAEANYLSSVFCYIVI